MSGYGLHANRHRRSGDAILHHLDAHVLGSAHFKRRHTDDRRRLEADERRRYAIHKRLDAVQGRRHTPRGIELRGEHRQRAQPRPEMRIISPSAQ